MGNWIWKYILVDLKKSFYIPKLIHFNKVRLCYFFVTELNSRYTEYVYKFKTSIRHSLTHTHTRKNILLIDCDIVIFHRALWYQNSAELCNNRHKLNVVMLQCRNILSGWFNATVMKVLKSKHTKASEIRLLYRRGALH